MAAAPAVIAPTLQQEEAEMGDTWLKKAEAFPQLFIFQMEPGMWGC